MCVGVRHVIGKLIAYYILILQTENNNYRPKEELCTLVVSGNHFQDLSRTAASFCHYLVLPLGLCTQNQHF